MLGIDGAYEIATVGPVEVGCDDADVGLVEDGAIVGGNVLGYNVGGNVGENVGIMVEGRPVVGGGVVGAADVGDRVVGGVAVGATLEGAAVGAVGDLVVVIGQTDVVAVNEALVRIQSGISRSCGASVITTCMMGC